MRDYARDEEALKVYSRNEDESLNRVQKAERNLSSLDGETFAKLIFTAQEYLASRKKEVDALNVFPVPDGDTGTNMSLTLSSAAENVRKLGDASLSLSEVAETASHGALMGARGNSGVILSQILRGIAKAFAGKQLATADDIGAALDQAVSTAYKAVMKPTEGTILTVLRAVRDSVVSSLGKTKNIPEILSKALKDAREALARTPDQLPVLKQAGVVDAGGKGLVLILEAFVSWFSHEGETGWEQKEAEAAASLVQPNVTREDILSIENPYDTQFLIYNSSASPDQIRAHLESMGDSVLVVGSSELMRVHIHTKVPGEVLSYCLKWGVLSQVTVDNMIQQSQEAMGKRQDKTSYAGTIEGPRDVPAKEIGIISVATGEGLKEIMKSLGCDMVIDGGPTMNPSTSDLLSAVKSLKAKKIIFIPNNGNIFLAAKQAKKLFGRNMYIVPSRTIPQGISALLSLNLQEDMEHNLKRAAKAVRAVKTGEVTYSARDGRFGHYVMKRGDILGLVDGKVEAVGTDPEDILKKIVKTMVREEDSVVTIYYGQDRSEDVVRECVKEIQDELGTEVEVEYHNGGQPIYFYLVSVE